MRKNDLESRTRVELQAALAATKRVLATKEAHDRLLPFVRFTMPDPNDDENVDASRYETTPQGKMLCEIIERVESGKLKRVAVSMGPQHGKSHILSFAGPAWLMGKNPRRNMILGSYNQDKANEFGGDVRFLMESQPYKQVFPNIGFRSGSAAKDYMITSHGGKMAFVGTGASGTGKPADIFIVDDPTKNDEDSQSEVVREKVWTWFNRVSRSRLNNDSAIIVVQTRWHEDDLIGRLCDPDHPERNKKYAGIAKRWTYINIPAVVDDPELAKVLGLTLEVQTDPDVVQQFGTKPISALWPSSKGLPLLAEAKEADAHGFSALYMGKPAPDDGDFFKREWLVEYDRDELPKRLRKYGASDHAVTEKKQNDANVIGCVGVDEQDHIWVMPDLVWDRMETDRLVEEILTQLKVHKPLLWWMEQELISRSFGPFLYKRMAETKTYAAIDGVVVHRDKKARAQAIKGRLAMKMVHFPRFVSWWPAARSQILRFPFATHDDFVDWLGHIGMGLTKEVAAEGEKPVNDNVPKTGTIEWVKFASAKRAASEKLQKAVGGW